MKSTEGMEVRKRKRTLAATFFLIILTILGFAYTAVRYPDRMPDAGYRMPDTIVRQGGMKTDSVYRSYVYGADKLVQEKKYDEALLLLDKAIAIRPNEATLRNKVIQVKAFAAQQKKDNEEFIRLMASADKYFSAKAYLDAKSTYQLALNLNPDDKNAQDRLNQTMGILRSQKAQNILYDVAVANADKFYAEGDLDKAKTEYEKASQILPGDQYAKDKVNEIIKIQVDRQVREELYAQAITKADQLFKVKKYTGALTEYKNALKQKPDEQYPKDRIKELTELLNQQKALDEAYQQALAAADQLFVAKRYLDAKTGYQEALEIKQDEAYPKGKIREIDQILAGMLRTAEEYERVIAQADSFYIDKNFILARQNYQMALQIKPNEAYPKEMLSKAELGMSTQEQTQKMIDESYAATITAADKLFWDKLYEDARKQYTSALALKPNEAYPKTRIAEIDKALEVMDQLKKTREEQYASLISKADQAFAAKSWDDALAGYNQALAMKPDEQYPKDKVAEIGLIKADILKQKEAVEQQYATIIGEADRLLEAKNYNDSRTKYNEALGLKPAETYPKTKIAEIDGILAGLEKQKASDEQYANLIAEADKLLADKAYPDSKIKYQSASAMKPAEEYPKKKIAEIDAIFAQQKEFEERYAGLITAADKLFASGTYEEARKNYTDALNLKPAEKYPQEKVAEIDAMLGDIAKQKAIDEQYASIISSADKLFGSKSYEEAKGKYNEALVVKPAETYPKTKIAEIDNTLAGIASQKALDDQYAGLVAEGDKLFAEKTYADSKAKYEAALGLKPAETYPKTKISEIEAIFADIAKQKKDLDDRYAGLIASGDKLLAAKTYDEARKNYTDALSLKPTEKYPQEKVAEIDAMLGDIAKQKAIDEQYASIISSADKLFGSKSYEEAKGKYNEALAVKPAEAYPKTKIAEIDKVLEEIARQKALDEQYAGLVAEGDKLFAEKTYADSKAKYEAALGLKPAETYPKTKIAEIDAIFANIAKQKKDLEDRYAGLIAGADKLFAAKTYEEAKKRYTDALGLKPEEKYPQEKIAQIDGILADIAKQKALDDQYASIIAAADKLLAAKTFADAKVKYNEALTLKPAEEYPKTKIAEIDKALEEIAKQKALDEQYAGLVADGDKLFGEKSYSDSKAKYEAALALKPSETYPRTKISEIDGILAGIAKQKGIDDQYAGIIAKADQFLAVKSYQEAKTEYQNALKVKPSEQYPKDKISEIDAALAELNRQKTINDQYKAQVTKADQLFSTKQYEPARAEYVKAQGIKAEEQYPKDRIAEIDNILSEFRERDESYRASVTRADQLFGEKSYEPARSEYQNASAIKPLEQYPKDKIGEINRILTEIQGKKVTYDNLLKSAGDFLASKEYNKSKEQYLQASGIFPEEQFPKERISWITRTVDSIYRVNKADYDKAVANGDKFYTAFEFDKAIDSYTEASGFLPMENYPKEQIAKIRRTISENAIVDVLKTPVTIAAGDEKKFSFEPVNIASRKDNFVYLKIRNLSDKPFNILMRYGRDAQSNGGVVIRNVSTDGKVNERLISVRDQDLWYRADNNWISLFPQGGDIEVSFIQVSKVR